MGENSRRHLRYAPDEGTIAMIDPESVEDRATFQPRIPALILDEALDGCGVVVLRRTHPLAKGDRCLVRVANLDPLLAEVRWVAKLDTDVEKIGIMFLE